MSQEQESPLNEFIDKAEPKETQTEPTPDAVVVSEKTEASKAKEEPKVSRTQKRIDDLVRQKHELKAEVDTLKAKDSAKEDEKEGDKTSIETEKEIKLSDFASYKDYIDALETETEADYADGQPIESKEVKSEPKVDTEFSIAIEQLQTKMDIGREKYKDFDEKVYSNNAVVSEAMVIGFNDSDISGELAYYYATHTDEAVRASKMNERQLIREFARKEIELQTPKVVTQKSTNAPTPIVADGGGAMETSIDDMSADEFGRFMESKQSSW